MLVKIKMKILIKNRKFRKKSKLLSKIEIVWSKIEISVKNRNLCQKSKLSKNRLVKIEISVKKRNCLVKN